MCLSEQAMDDLCEAFEEQWTRDNSGPDGLEVFLKAQKCTEPFAPELLATLIIVDIERSWLSWHNLLKQQAAIPADRLSIEAILESFANLPTLGSYDELTRIDLFDKDLKSEIVQHEARARNRWGDAVGPEYYRTHYGVETGVATGIATGIGSSCPLRYVYIADSEITSEAACVRFPLRGLNRLGRQRSFDSSPLVCEQLAEGNRITIADDLNAHISRNQLTVQLLSPECVVITNTGRQHSVFSRNMDDYPPGVPVLRNLPVDLKLAQCRLRIR